MSSAPYATARAATTLSGLALLSPLAGMAVEMALAWRFGASPTVDAFRIGAVFLLLGQQLLVLQILPHIIVPVFTEYRARAGEQEAWRVALSLGNVFLFGAILFALLVCLRPGAIVWLFAAGLTGEARDAAIVFIRWFALAYVPLVASGVATGILYVHGVFWLPIFAQLLSNVVLALAIVMPSKVPAVIALAGGLLLASILGAAIHVIRVYPLLRTAGARLPLQLNLGHAGVKTGLALAAPMLGVFLVGQWGPIVVNRVLSGMPLGTLSTFGYAFKMGLLVSLAPISLATVLFPKFAEGKLGAEEEFRALCTRGLRMGVFLAMPLAACAFVLRRTLVALLFLRGAFSSQAAEGVALLFGVLVLGAPAASAAVFLEKMFYAAKQAWIPTWVRFGSMVLLTVLVAPAVRHGAPGMALVLTLLAWSSAAALFAVLVVRNQAFAVPEMAFFVALMSLLSAVSAWAGGEVGRWLGRTIEVPLLSMGLEVAAGVAAASGLFFIAATALRVPEALGCTRFLRWQGNALVRWVQGGVRS